MKKRILTLLAVVMVLASLTGCRPKATITQSTTNVDEAATLGNYFLYETQKKQEYLNFLESFDTSKYEIVDISIGYVGRNFSDTVCNYAVTYKNIEQESE